MIPNHVAIILDGNGRWAAANGKSRSQGHLAGADNVETISDALIERGVKYLTVYAFSTENWKRSEEEVEGIMDLLREISKDKLILMVTHNTSIFENYPGRVFICANEKCVEISNETF